MAHTPLTKTEIAVLRWVATGITQEETGKHLGLTVDVVKSQLRKIFKKLGAANTAHGIALGYVHGYLPIEHQGPPNPALEPEQIQVLHLIARGKDRKHIAKELNIPFMRVRNHIDDMTGKLSARNRYELVHRGFQTGNLVVITRTPTEGDA